MRKVDIFLHDSDHSYTNTYFELRSVARSLSANAVAVADDVDSNGAWQAWNIEMRPQTSAVIREVDKAASFGFCIFSRK